MSFADDIRDGIATIHQEVGSVELTVSFSAWIGQKSGADGEDDFATAVPLTAMTILTRKKIWKDGRLVDTQAYLLFLTPIPDTAANSGFTRDNPVDPKDIFTLPDGTTGPTILGKGLMDPSTQRPYMLEVYIGA